MCKRLTTVLLVALLMLPLVLGGCSQPSTPVESEAPEETETTEPAETQEAEKYEWRFNVSVAEESSWTRGAKKFAEIVSEKTGGNISITVYPNEQLSGGSMTTAVDMARAGTFEFDLRSTLAWSFAEPMLGALSLPFAFTSYEEVDEILAGEVGDIVKDIMADNNLELLGFGENGFRQLTTKGVAVSSPDDMRGLKVRVPTSPVLVETFNSLGADPTVINFAELFMALQLGTIDGQENPLGLIQSSKLYEVQDYVTMWNYCYDPLLLTIHKDLWESLSPEYKEVLTSAAIEAMEWQIEINRGENDDILNYLKEQGLEPIFLSDEQIEAFKQVTQEVYTKMESEFGKDLIEAIQR